MQSYCVYLLFMSMNGMSEAFAYGLATPHIIKKLQGMLVFNSILYIASVVVLSSKFGIIGLIYANCVNMAIRAIYSLFVSLDGRNIGILKLGVRIITNKVFVGLILMGCVATVSAKVGMEYILKILEARRVT